MAAVDFLEICGLASAGGRVATGSLFRFVDLASKTISENIGVVFPDWAAGQERVVVLSPHDDDGILGAGHAILASLAFGGEVHILIYSCGCLGYSSPEQKETIVETRRRETYEAYKTVGVPMENIHRLEFDDLSVLGYIGWRMPGGAEGTVAKVIPLLRRIRATRLLIPNHYRENVDHEAVFKSGVYEGPQVGDAIIGDQGSAEPIKSAMQYSVWGDFSPEEALIDGRNLSIRANTLILCESSLAERLNDAIAAWKSQSRIIDGLVRAREARRYSHYMMEAYIRFDPRPALDYRPYASFLESTFGGSL